MAGPHMAQQNLDLAAQHTRIIFVVGFPVNMAIILIIFTEKSHIGRECCVKKTSIGVLTNT